MADKDYVVFEDSSGNVISNDPRWHAERTLKQGGVDVNSLQDENAELRRQLAELQAAQVADNSAEATGGLEEEDDNDEAAPYADVKGADLGKLARERGIDTKGKKAGEVRAELAAQDAAKA